MFHLQNNPQDWPVAVANLPAGAWVKFVGGVQRAAEAKAVNSEINTVFRHWYDPNQIPSGSYEANKQLARTFFDTFIDASFMQVAQHVDAIEDWNEYFGNHQDPAERARFISWSRAVNEVWTTEYRSRPGLSHIRLVVANTAVGNDIPLETAVATYIHGNILGYHPYVPVNREIWPQEPSFVRPGEWQWYSGRWASMDESFKAEGIHVSWLFTEWGAIGDRGGGPQPLDGWRQPWIYNGNLEEYKGMMGYWFDRFENWNQANQHRALWPVIFTSSPPGNQWDWFDLQQPDMNDVAIFSQQFEPGDPDPAPPPDPVPPPNPHDYALGTDVSHWQGSINWETMAEAGADFTFIKATEGRGPNPDPRFYENWAAAKAAQLQRGAYHFYRNHIPYLEQADFFLATVGDDIGELPFVIDCEDTNGETDPDELLEFLSLLNGYHHQPPIIYTGSWWWNPRIGDDPRFHQFNLWIANWRNNPPPVLPAGWEDWRFWQYTNEGVGSEYGARSRYIDLNYFNGTTADLVEWAGPPVIEPREWAKTVILLHQSTTLQWYGAVTQKVAYDTRTEVTFSEDAAFAPQVGTTSHRVIVYNVQDWGGREVLEAWVRQHYGMPTEIIYRQYGPGSTRLGGKEK